MGEEEEGREKNKRRKRGQREKPGFIVCTLPQGLHGFSINVINVQSWIFNVPKEAKYMPRNDHIKWIGVRTK